MSYDLFLEFPTNVTKEDIVRFFTERANYKVTEKEFFYNNERTGVYFIIYFSEGNKGHFNLNYCRPSFFGLEAEIEVANLLKQFPCRIEDPQMHGMGNGPYSREGFLRGWNAGNEFGSQVVLSQTKTPVWTLPSAQLQRTWQWNYDLPRREAERGGKQFIPLILYMNIAGKAKTVVVWGNGIATFLPYVDFILVGRPGVEGNVYKNIFGLAPWEQIAELLAPLGYSRGAEGIDLDYDNPPKPVMDFVRQIAPAELSQIPRISSDRILDEELVVKMGLQGRVQ